AATLGQPRWSSRTTPPSLAWPTALSDSQTGVLQALKHRRRKSAQGNCDGNDDAAAAAAPPAAPTLPLSAPAGVTFWGCLPKFRFAGRCASRLLRAGALCRCLCVAQASPFA